MIEGLILGLSSGLSCLTSCGPVILPWLAAEGQSVLSTARRLVLFVLGRYIGYLAFAFLAWSLGSALGTHGRMRAQAMGMAYIAIAITLLAYAWASRFRSCDDPAPCPVHAMQSRTRQLAGYFRQATPIVLGALTGLNVCPPFIAAGLRASAERTAGGALVFFTWFFLGTSVWFVPAVAIGWLRRIEGLTIVARMMTVLIAAYYAYLGAIALIGAWIHV